MSPSQALKNDFKTNGRIQSLTNAGLTAKLPAEIETTELFNKEKICCVLATD